MTSSQATKLHGRCLNIGGKIFFAKGGSNLQIILVLKMMIKIL